MRIMSPRVWNLIKTITTIENNIEIELLRELKDNFSQK